MSDYVLWFEDLGMNDVARVGGKNASLGEMIRNLADAGVRVPRGFATTAAVYRDYLRESGLDRRIDEALGELDIEDTEALARAGQRVRQWILDTPLPEALQAAIREAFERLQTEEGREIAVAVRSSATAEDLPEASFAGQQETVLNVRGADEVLSAVREVFASLFTDRAIAYRVHHGFDHRDVALSAGIQRMVHSDLAASGVVFTLDTESGFPRVVFITAAYGLGETVVQGSVNPDEFYVYKPALQAGARALLRRNLGEKAIKLVYDDDPKAERPVKEVEVEEPERRRFCISEDEAQALAGQAVAIEAHYGRPMDIEWAKDGESGELYIVQARPETVKSRGGGDMLERYYLKQRGTVLAEGRAIGQRIGAGPACVVINASEMGRIRRGDVIVTDMTDPDWEPVMKRAAAVVTNRGGRTCHAAIVARELGIPAIVGTGEATDEITDGREVTVSCAEGDTGFVYDGVLDYDVRRLSAEEMPALPVKIMLNVGNPDRAFDFQWLPCDGVGLARLEFIINRMIGVHPRAVLEYDTLEPALQEEIARHAAGYADPVTFYVEKLAEGIAMIGAAFDPKPVIVRLSDFKSNEYANLVGGEGYEPKEENPMLGFRGASRYIDESFRRCFELECRALTRVREETGLTNVEIMVPFVRSVEEAEQVIDLLRSNGLERGKHGLRLIMMCEIPANAVLADRFLDHFDGYSIGSNDLTQLTLGVDRDSGLITGFDERDPAVLELMAQAIAACRRRGKYIGICGQAPSDYPEITEWLVDHQIESISLNPDSVVDMIEVIEKMASAGGEE